MARLGFEVVGEEGGDEEEPGTGGPRSISLIQTQLNNPYRFGGKERLDVGGLDLYDFGARHYNPALPRWLTLDPLAEKYYGVSSYAYCENNPISVVDPQGDTTFVLFAANGASGFGHIGFAVQDNEGNYRFYSKNGYDEGGENATKSIVGRLSGSESNLGTLMEGGISRFLDSSISNSVKMDRSDFPYYTEAYMIPTNQEQDAIISEAALEAISRPYSLFADNCAHTVAQSLARAEVPTIRLGLSSLLTIPFKVYVKQTVPRVLYHEIKANNPGGIVLKPTME